jgi:hypothetical protein
VRRRESISRVIVPRSTSRTSEAAALKRIMMIASTRSAGTNRSNSLCRPPAPMARTDTSSGMTAAVRLAA